MSFPYYWNNKLKRVSIFKPQFYSRVKLPLMQNNKDGYLDMSYNKFKYRL